MGGVASPVPLDMPLVIYGVYVASKFMESFTHIYFVKLGNVEEQRSTKGKFYETYTGEMDSLRGKLVKF